MAGDRAAVRLHDAAAALPSLAIADDDGLSAPEWTAVRALRPLAGDAAPTFVDRLLADPAVAFAAPLLVDSAGVRRIPTSELIVRFEPTVSPAQAAALLAAHGAGPIVATDAFGLPNTFVTRPETRDGRVVVAIADALSDLPAVRFAEPDWLLDAASGTGTSDPDFSSQWGLNSEGQVLICGGTCIDDVDMDVPEAWDITQGSPSVIVVVIDNGAELDHFDLLLPAWLGFDATGEGGGGGPVGPCDNHGTAVAGCVAAIANNSEGVVGVSPGISCATARISTASTSCAWTVQPSWVAAALKWSADIGARVTNTSWSFAATATITDAYAMAEEKGLINFACSQNWGQSTVSFPASLPSVIAVGAVTKYASLAGFSNYGSDQELVAPGVDLWTTDRMGVQGNSPGSYACFTGTSGAAPYVAGVAALMASANPNLTGAQLRTLLRSSAVDLGPTGWDQKYGWGLVNAERAVRAALHPGDLNFDGAVDAQDVGLLLVGWGAVVPVGDLDASGMVGGPDLGLLLSDWTG